MKLGDPNWICPSCYVVGGAHTTSCIVTRNEREREARVLALVKTQTDPLVARIEALERLHNPPDTIPAPPIGDSHSGAVVVPRGSSAPPDVLTEVEIGLGMPTGYGAIGEATGNSILGIPGACWQCRMLACVCGLTGNGAGAP